MDVLPHGKLPSREEATGDEQDGQCDLEAVDVRIIHDRHITVADHRLDQRANMPRPLSNFRPCKNHLQCEVGGAADRCRAGELSPITERALKKLYQALL